MPISSRNRFICKKVKSTGFLFAFLFLLCIQSVVAQLVKMDTYNPDSPINPLPGSAVFAIQQDSVGRMWFGIIGAGLVYYDSKEFHAFGEEQGFPELNTVLSIKKGFDNDIWILATNQVMRIPLPKNDLLKIDSLELKKSLQKSETQVIDLYTGYSQAHGDDNFCINVKKRQVWVATAQHGLIRYTQKANKFWSVDTLLLTNIDPKSHTLENDVRAIWLRKNGELVISSSAGIIYILDDLAQEQTNLSEFKTLPKRFFSPFSKQGETWETTFYEDETGRLWAGTTNGKVWYVDEALYKFGNESLEKKAHLIINVGLAIQELKKDKSGKLWIGSDNGLLIFNPKTNTFLFPKGISGKSTISIFVDKEQDVWAGTFLGLYKFPYDYASYTLFTVDDPKVKTQEVYSVAPVLDQKNQFWIGTTEGLIHYDLDEKDEAFIILNENDGLSSNSVFDVIQDSNGLVWMATLRGISVLNPKKTEILKSQASQKKNTKLGLLESIKVRGTFLAAKEIILRKDLPIILFPGYNGLGMFYKNRLYSFLNPVDVTGIALNDVIQIGNRWILGAENAGLFISKIPITEKVLDELIKPSQLNEHGLYVIKEEFFRRAPIDTFYTNWSMSDLTLSKDSLLWAVSGNGLVAFDIKELIKSDFSTFKVLKTRSKKEGFPLEGFTAIEPFGENLVVFSNKGIGVYDVKKDSILDWFTKSSGLADDFTWRKSGALVQNGFAYSGTGKGLVRLELNQAKNEIKTEIKLNKVSHEYALNGTNKHVFDFRWLSFAEEKQHEFLYRLKPYEKKFTKTKDSKIGYTNLRAFFWNTEYELEIQASSDRLKAEAPFTYRFSVSPPFYFTWWFILFVGFVCAGAGNYWYKSNLKRLRERESLKAEQKQFETVQRIGASIAHDLKNSIFSLSLLAANLEKRFDNPSFRKDAIDTLEASLEHMNSLVYRLNQRQTDWKIERTKTDLVKTIQTTLTRLQIEQYQQIEWKIDLPETFVFSHDSIAIQRVLDNLILNALEASSNQGKIRLTLKKEQDGASIEISDSGTGMTEKFIQANLFKPFITTKANGLGLGLFTCREIINAHNGSLTVKSEISIGSTFVVYIKSE